MGLLELSQVQIANLNMLILVAEYIKRDSVVACSRFGLDADQADYIASLTFHQILATVAHLGDECLFPPRSDLVQVLSWPPQIASALLMVHPGSAARPTPTSEPATGTPGASPANAEANRGT